METHLRRATHAGPPAPRPPPRAVGLFLGCLSLFSLEVPPLKRAGLPRVLSAYTPLYRLYIEYTLCPYSNLFMNVARYPDAYFMHAVFWSIRGMDNGVWCL